MHKARNNNCLIILMRSSKKWDNEQEENILVYNSAEACGGSLGINSRG